VDITRALVKAGGNTIVISGNGRLLPDMLRTGARHIMMAAASGNPFKTLINAWKIARLVRNNNISVLHVRSPAHISSVSLARRLQPVKLVATLHDLDGKNPRDSRRLSRALEKFDHVVAVSHFMGEKIRESGIASSKITLIPRGIDMSRFDPETVKPYRLVDQAKKWRLPDGLPLILVPSRLSPAGGQAFLIETLATLKDLPFTCLIPGDEAINPGHRRELEELIIKLGLNEQVRFAGFCDDMPAAYLLADVVVTAALKPEAFSRVAVEAQAMGRPLVAAAHGGAREAVTPDVTGLLFEPGNSESLAKTLRQALKMPLTKRTALGRAARRHVMQHYTLEHMCKGTLDLYAALDGAAAKS
jgi:glycosyltransferase involved in cell wall biosynthesis